jgi:hypothetical protein
MKRTPKHYCVKCEKKLEPITLGGFDALALLSERYSTFFCKNNKCEHFGVITIAARSKS